MKNSRLFNGQAIEMIDLKGEILFNAKQVGECLGIANINKNIANMDNDEVIKVTNKMILGITKGYSRKLNNFGENFLTELGVYSLAFKSQKEQAKEFKKWVATVLKDIRKNGFYIADEKAKSWLDIREEGKGTRKMFTDTLKELRQYAIKQGSKNYEMRENLIYQTYSKLLNKTLGITTDGTKTRCNLSQMELMQLATFENIQMQVIIKGMKNDCHYKHIYKDVKQVLEDLIVKLG